MAEPILHITGSVARSAELTFSDLAGLAAEHQIADLSQLDATRSGQAVALQGILDLVQPLESADYLTLHAAADDFHASIPLAEVRDRGVIIYALHGKSLPAGKGGPVRFYIPNHAACKMAEIDECANVKYLSGMEFTVGRGFDNRPTDEEEHRKLHEGEAS